MTFLAVRAAGTVCNHGYDGCMIGPRGPITGDETWDSSTDLSSSEHPLSFPINDSQTDIKGGWRVQVAGTGRGAGSGW